MLQFHGTSDNIVSYTGLRPVVPMMEGWAERNGCAAAPETSFAQGDMTCQTWPGCDAGVEVTLELGERDVGKREEEEREHPERRIPLGPDGALRQMEGMIAPLHRPAPGLDVDDVLDPRAGLLFVRCCQASVSPGSRFG